MILSESNDSRLTAVTVRKTVHLGGQHFELRESVGSRRNQNVYLRTSDYNYDFTAGNETM